MTFFILAAGYGRRAEPLSRLKPKPALPLGGRPLISLLLAQLRRLGCREGFINLHHLGGQVADAVGAAPEVRWIEERELSGSRVLARARPLSSPWLLAVNGDTYLEVPLAEMEREAAAPGVDGVLLARHDPSGRYARLLHEKGLLLGSEPPAPDGRPGWMYAGAGLFSERALERIDEDNFFASIRRHGLRFRLAFYDGIWLDLGTPAGYFRANWDYLAHCGLQRENILSPGASLSPQAVVRRSILWENARVGPGVSLSGCIVTAGMAPARGEYRERILSPLGDFPLG